MFTVGFTWYAGQHWPEQALAIFCMNEEFGDLAEVCSNVNAWCWHRTVSKFLSIAQTSLELTAILLSLSRKY